MPWRFGLLGASLGFQGLDGLSADTAAPSAAYIKENFPSSPDGVYWIERQNNTPIQVYCDMTRDGGGWMLINASNSTLSVNKGTASWNGDLLTSRFGEGGCSSTFAATVNYTLNNIPFASWGEVRLLMRRISTIGQCSNIVRFAGTETFTGFYETSANNDAAIEQYSGTATATSNATCLWGDGRWANACCSSTNMSGLKPFWVFMASGDNLAPQYSTTCGGGTQGDHTHKWYVR